MMMILTATTKMKRVVVVHMRVAAAQSAPFQRKTTLSVVLHHHRERVFSFSLSLSLLLHSFILSKALNRNNTNQPIFERMRRKQQSEERNAGTTQNSVFRVSYKP